MHYVYYIERYWGLIVYLRSYGIINLDQMKCPDTSLFMFNSFYYMKSLSYLLVDSFLPQMRNDICQITKSQYLMASP